MTTQNLPGRNQSDPAPALDPRMIRELSDIKLRLDEIERSKVGAPEESDRLRRIEDRLNAIQSRLGIL